MARKNGGPAPSVDLLYAFAMFLWRSAVTIFFREIRPRGAFHIPQEGPVIFVAAPHNNQVCVPSIPNACILSHKPVRGHGTCARGVAGDQKEGPVLGGREEHEAAGDWILRSDGV